MSPTCRRHIAEISLTYYLNMSMVMAWLWPRPWPSIFIPPPLLIPPAINPSVIKPGFNNRGGLMTGGGVSPISRPFFFSVLILRYISRIYLRYTSDRVCSGRHGPRRRQRPARSVERAGQTVHMEGFHTAGVRTRPLIYPLYISKIKISLCMGLFLVRGLIFGAFDAFAWGAY